MEKSPHFQARPVRVGPDRSPSRHDPANQKHQRRPIDPRLVFPTMTSTNTMVAELVGNWATPQRMALVPLLAADPPMLPVY
jgi:hypothetical protein